MQVHFLVSGVASASEVCYGYHIMKATVKMDNADRFILPKPVRDKLQLWAGDSLELEVSGSHIVLRPARSGRMRKVHGVWVLHTGGGPISPALVRRTLNKIRRERERKALGLPR
jgi:AbrB family looped-hinge helix DNA binding protein